MNLRKQETHQGIICTYLIYFNYTQSRLRTKIFRESSSRCTSIFLELIQLRLEMFSYQLGLFVKQQFCMFQGVSHQQGLLFWLLQVILVSNYYSLRYFYFEGLRLTCNVRLFVCKRVSVGLILQAEIKPLSLIILSRKLTYRFSFNNNTFISQHDFVQEPRIIFFSFRTNVL